MTSPDPTTPALESAGRAASEREVLTALAPRVRGWIYRYVGPHRDIEDLVQQALLEIAVALDRFDGRSSVATYAHRIALRVAGHQLRRLRREPVPNVHLVQDAADACDPEQVAMGREGLRHLYDALGKLPAKQRAAFVLCCIEGLPHEGAASVEGVSIGTLRTRLKRGRAQLAKELRQQASLAPLFEGRQR